MFHRASKSKCKLRLALHGPSGSGKTFTSLRIATGIGGKIAVIDSERGRASKYSDRFLFDVNEITDMSIDGYIAAIQEARKYDTLIIDSASHAWKELKELADSLTEKSYKGNSLLAWAKCKPMHKKFVQAILEFPGHIIATMRVETDWQTQRDEKTGKVRPVKIGLKPVQEKEFEYDFDVILSLDSQHIAHVEKDNTSKFQDTTIEMPGEDFGKQLVEWLSEGSEPVASTPPAPAKSELETLVEKYSIKDDIKNKWIQKYATDGKNLSSIPQHITDQIIEKIKANYETKPAA